MAFGEQRRRVLISAGQGPNFKGKQGDKDNEKVNKQCLLDTPPHSKIQWKTLQSNIPKAPSMHIFKSLIREKLSKFS